MAYRRLLDEFFETAWLESDKSRCIKKKVGAVLVGLHDPTGEWTIISSGHGDAPKMIECTRDCGEKGCEKYTKEWFHDTCWSVHAEERALLDAAENAYTDPGMRADLTKLKMLVTHGPCDQCLKLMVEFGVEEVIFDYDYKTDYSKWEPYIKISKRSNYGNQLH